MKDYHYVWLDNHTDRTEKWLEGAISEGFDIHHMDGDHDNTDSTNLVLIEISDHFMLHSNGNLKRLTMIPGGK